MRIRVALGVPVKELAHRFQKRCLVGESDSVGIIAFVQT
jgi:hypothetical protein